MLTTGRHNSFLMGNALPNISQACYSQVVKMYITRTAQYFAYLFILSLSERTDKVHLDTKLQCLLKVKED